MNVRGIGEKAFLKLKPLVTVPAKADKPTGEPRGAGPPNRHCGRPSFRRTTRDDEDTARTFRPRCGTDRPGLCVCARSASSQPLPFPAIHASRDRDAARAAARYLAHRLQMVRLEALRRNVCVAIRFDPVDIGRFGVYVGRRRRRRAAGRHRPRHRSHAVTADVRLADFFAAVAFRIPNDVPDPERHHVLPANSDPLRLGSSNFLSFSPLGSCHERNALSVSTDRTADGRSHHGCHRTDAGVVVRRGVATVARGMTVSLERRARFRVPPGHTPWARAAILRPGQDVTIINLSAGGALVESSLRMKPGRAR